MQLSIDIKTKTEQNLVLTQHLMQRLSILHMTLQEVRALVNEQIETNPFLETEAVFENTAFSHVSLDELYAKQNTENTGNEHDEEPPLLRFDTTNFRCMGAGGGDGAPADFLEFTSRPQSLAEYLELQLTDYPLDARQTKICRYLINSLDERGFLSEPVEAIAAREHLDAFELTQMLYVLQSLDPAGIGARDLQECLILQLAAGEAFNGTTVRIVKECLELLSQNKIPAIAKRLSISENEAERACDVIRNLSPIPTRGFYTGEESNYIVPDALITHVGDDLVIQMNDSMIPHLILNPDYEKMAKDSDDPVVKKYLQEHRAAAEVLIGNISARNEMLYRILREITRWQWKFFLDGRSLLPMTMAELADKLGVHTSTISRGVSGKYIVCVAGTISLRTLFTSGYQSREKAVSATVIKRKLLELIAAEDPAAPLSDEALCKIFREMEIDISRRTVAKYREEQGIPSSMRRKSNWR